MPKKAPKKKPNNLKSAIEDNYKSSANRKNVAKALNQSKSIKSTKNYVVYNPITKIAHSGTLAEVSKQIGSTAATVRSRVDGGKQQFNKVSGFQIFRFKDADDMVGFKNAMIANKADKVDKKNVASPDFSGFTGEDEAKSYKTRKTGFKFNKKYGMATNSYALHITDDLRLDDIGEILIDLMADAVKTRKLAGDDFFRILIDDDNLAHYLSTKKQRIKDFNPNDLFALLSDLQTSADDYKISSDTKFIVETVEFKGGVRKKKNILKETAFQKSSLIKINNGDDYMCMARAIVVGLYRHKYGASAIEYRRLIMGETHKASHPQTHAAIRLHEEAGVDIPESEDFMCGMMEIRMFEEYISRLDEYDDEWEGGYSLAIIDGNFGNNILYPDTNDADYKPAEETDKIIYLHFRDAHYDLISNNRIAGFFGRDYYCKLCFKSFNNKDSHNSCPYYTKCDMCGLGYEECAALRQLKAVKHKDKLKHTIKCYDCHRYFAHLNCFDNHKIPDKKTKKSICQTLWKCHKCRRIVHWDRSTPETHICGEGICGNCGLFCQPLSKHKCYMMPKKLLDPSEKYVFYDFESHIDDGKEKDEEHYLYGKEHSVMFSVSMYYHDPTPIIHRTIDEFCKWAICEEHKDFTFIAHYGKGYDAQFIMRWLYNNTTDPPSQISAGMKLMMVSCPAYNIRFIDSFSFVSQPLASFPKTFGEKELKKGYFPHGFNTRENLDYEGPMPPKETFFPDGMKSGAKKDFEIWYDKKVAENYVWKNLKECEEYCISDVDILRKCMFKFRQLFLSKIGIDPLRYLTIAGVCMAIYRFKFVDKSYPERLSDYLEMVEDKKGEERKMMKEEFEAETREIIFDEKKFGIFKFSDTEIIRQAFFGGRTNGVKLLWDFEKTGTYGEYDDVTSLYPTVQAFDRMPKGHFTHYKYEEINKDANSFDEFLNKVKNGEIFGFIDCRIVPPNNLYHPVLPTKGEKLFFDLTEKQGIWCSNEIAIALNKGYRITNLFNILHFEETDNTLFADYVYTFLKIKQEASGYPQWVYEELDKDGKGTNKYYNDTILEQNKRKYISDYEEESAILDTDGNIVVPGIKLDYDEIFFEKKKVNGKWEIDTGNPGLRLIAKLCLNSLWGKFGQRTNLGEDEYVSQKSKFIEIYNNPQYDLKNIIEINDEVMYMSWEVKEKFIENDYNTNLAIAAFTTSSARARLYKGIDYLDKQVLYFDTDSIVYYRDPKNPDMNKYLVKGDGLGEWTSELDGSKMIGTFACAGPKNYSYETSYAVGKPPKIFHTKVKGFNLNSSVEKKINHQSIITTIENKYINKMSDEDNSICVQYNMCRINAKNDENYRAVFTSLQNKNYKVVYTKREVLPPKNNCIDTIPFGHHKL